MTSQLPCLSCGQGVTIAFPVLKGPAKMKYRCQQCGAENLITLAIHKEAQVPAPPLEQAKADPVTPAPLIAPRATVDAGPDAPTLFQGSASREPTLVGQGVTFTSQIGKIHLVEGGRPGKAYELKVGRQAVGRWSPGVTDCEIQVPVKDLTLSRRHFQIQVLRTPLGQFLYKISDLHSKNKTRLIGQSGEVEIGNGSELYLNHGDIIVAGQTQFFFSDK